MRFTGMLDIQKTWERWLRRAHLELAYSQGFHPQPRIQQAAPLPLGYLSDDEIIDILLEQEKHTDEILHALVQCSPPGLEIVHLESVELNLPALQTQLKSTIYQVIPNSDISLEDLKRQVGILLGSSSILRERRGKTYDLRSLIEGLALNESDGSITIQLAAREGATGRPDEVIAALGFDPNSFGYTRKKLIFSSAIFANNDDEN